MKNIRWKLSLVCAFLFILIPLMPLQADDINDKISKLADIAMTDNKIPGLQLAVVFSDNQIIKQYHGKANLVYDVPVTDKTIFLIGSITKVFTAIAILKLNQEGKLSLKDKLSKYFPGFPNIKNITIMDILRHTSGLKDFLNVEPFSTDCAKYFPPQEIISSISKMGLDFYPGTKIQYDNTGYIILGEIIAKVSGKGYSEYIKNNLTIPLAMENTYMYSSSQIMKNIASGYVVEKLSFKNPEYAKQETVGASGGLASNVSDLIKLKQVFEGKIILNKDSVNELFKQETTFDDKSKSLIAKSGYVAGHGGCSFELLKYKERYISCKFGGVGAYTAMLLYDKANKIMVVVLTNTPDMNKILAKLAVNILDILVNK